MAPLNRSRHQAIEIQDASEGDGRRSFWKRATQSDYFPQRILSWLFLGSLGLSGWAAYEYVRQGSVKLQDPNQPRGLVVLQMAWLVPMALMPTLMFVYVQLNKQKKLDLQKRLDVLEASNRELRQQANLPLMPGAPAAEVPDNIV
jgi:hypothetical protein